MTTPEVARDWTSTDHPVGDLCRDDVHEWFELSYAAYLVWPRSLMQEMPPEWQHRFRQVAEEIDAAFRAPLRGHYEVRTRDDRGRYMADPLRSYRHPDARALDEARKP